MRSIVALVIVVSTFLATALPARETSKNTGGQSPDTQSTMCTVYLEYCEGGYANRRTFMPGEELVASIANALKRYSATVERRELNGAYREVRRIDDIGGSNFDSRICVV